MYIDIRRVNLKQTDITVVSYSPNGISDIPGGGGRLLSTCGGSSRGAGLAATGGFQTLYPVGIANPLEVNPPPDTPGGADPDAAGIRLVGGAKREAKGSSEDTLAGAIVRDGGAINDANGSLAAGAEFAIDGAGSDVIVGLGPIGGGPAATSSTFAS